MQWNRALWEQSSRKLPQFLAPLVAVMGRSERRVGATRYVMGLLMPGERKSIEPMAQRLLVDAQSLQQFVTDSPWSEDLVWRRLRQEVVPSLEPLVAWIVDETGWVKQGQHSVGVGHQYCGAVGKQANCQVSVEVVVWDGDQTVPIGGRLYLPETWTKDAKRRAAAGVPPEVEFATKPELALAIIRAARQDGVAPAPVLGDCAYGDNGDFRADLREQGLEFFLQVDARKHLGWTQPVTTVMKRTRRQVAEGTPAAQTLEAITRGLPEHQWHPASWKNASGETEHTRLAWCEVWLQEGLDRPENQPERVWLVVDWPAKADEPYHYYLAHFHTPPTTARCLRLSRGRWRVEQYFQRSKTDLGFDHYEGRSWQGFHHHLVLIALAYVFVVVTHLRAKKNFWCDVGADPPRDPAVVSEADRILLLLRHEV